MRPGLFITGSNFVNSTTLRCRVGEDIIQATYLLPTLVMCFPPPVEAGAGPKRVDVANNGVDFTLSSSLVYPHPICPPGLYCPGGDYALKHKAPRGAYAVMGAQNWTACPAGTYQPLYGQRECLRCPIGFQCPERGLPVPRLCPAGYVCDVTGTARADQPCPAGHFCLEGTATTATTCGHARPSSALFPTRLHAERHSTAGTGFGRERRTSPVEFRRSKRGLLLQQNGRRRLAIVECPGPLLAGAPLIAARRDVAVQPPSGALLFR